MKYMTDKEQLRAWREHLHQIPELELDLPETKAYLLEQLQGLDCEISHPIESAIACYFDFGQEQTIAFRADMDALPIAEKSGARCQSRHPNVCHACGHDGHMAMLLGLAWHVNGIKMRKEGLAANILLVFQPGEETPGGARLLCETGLLEKYNVKRVFGMHLWPMAEKGTISTRPGPMMARSAEVNVTITGKSVHAARYREGADALEAAVRFIGRVYDFERSLDPGVFRLLRFGKVDSGSTRNVVSDHALVQGTMRAFEPDIFQMLKDKLYSIGSEVAEQTGCTFDFWFSQGYPAVINDVSTAERILARDRTIGRLDVPEMISEDFSYYQQEVPGVFFFLGTGTGIALHDPSFDFDSDILANGVRLYAELVNMAADLLMC